MTDECESFLTPAEERILLQLAHDTLRGWVCKGIRVDEHAYALTPRLLEKRGAFVTLTAEGALRGCVGYTMNREPLAVTVRDNTINAAARDTRFAPVAKEELELISIEISVLTPGDSIDSPMKVVSSIEEIQIGRDGLYVEMPPNRGGLLLPQVATREKWTVEQFLAAVCRKAGYKHDAWKDSRVHLYRFSAHIFSDERQHAAAQ